MRGVPRARSSIHAIFPALDPRGDLFLLAKTVLVGTGLVVLHRCRAASIAQFGVASAVVTYGAVVAWHLAHVAYL